jgi:hypothetical protein
MFNIVLVLLLFYIFMFRTSSGLTQEIYETDGYTSEINVGGEPTGYVESLTSGLDSSIYESHSEYVHDTSQLASVGASHAATRDDFMPPVPFHGLPRCAHYANVGSEKSARVTQSETPEESLLITSHHCTSYRL